MGNKSSRPDESSVGSEMSSAKQFSGRNSEAEPPCDIKELWKECLALKDGAHLLAESIDDIFLDDEDTESGATEMEERLHEIIENNQAIIKKLSRNLERHAKLVDQGAEKNEELMAIVKYLVSTVNNYMTMLIRNIRRLRRLISEIKPLGNNNRLQNLQQQKKNNEQRLIYDVISDHQDVDAMLVQLLETEKQREELEKDIVTVLVFWKDYRYFHLLAADGEHSTEEIENNVKDAADSVAKGLASLNSKT